ncbi:hypothetical protein FACS189479_03090 [Spirochaetia bacterium]|nr:hypothetical protein FACS189479_03090 [Spirochaetia bacterium]
METTGAVGDLDATGAAAGVMPELAAGTVNMGSSSVLVFERLCTAAAVLS